MNRELDKGINLLLTNVCIQTNIRHILEDRNIFESLEMNNQHRRKSPEFGLVLRKDLLMTEGTVPIHIPVQESQYTKSVVRR